MCGIVGYIGQKQAAPILLDGLSKLEYRGYDSAGLAVRDNTAEPEIVKAKGRLKILSEKTNNGETMIGSCGIGHTRWATHGEPSEDNAHPHCTDDRSIIGVHNGIIDNYKELRDKLVRKGYSFHSQTDTEVAIKTVDYYLKKYNMGPIDAIVRAMVRVRGSYAPGRTRPISPPMFPRSCATPETSIISATTRSADSEQAPQSSIIWIRKRSPRN